jgi:hypothetical protein
VKETMGSKKGEQKGRENGERGAKGRTRPRGGEKERERVASEGKRRLSGRVE